MSHMEKHTRRLAKRYKTYWNSATATSGGLRSLVGFAPHSARVACLTCVPNHSNNARSWAMVLAVDGSTRSAQALRLKREKISATPCGNEAR